MKLLKSIEAVKKEGKKVVFTNGCFDILHQGHIICLREAKSFGDVLVVGLNTDSSISKLKGTDRPIKDEKTRMLILQALEDVDFVILFSEETPFQLIEKIKPHVLVKGGDYKPSEIIGAELVKSYGGEVKIVPYLKGNSSTQLINKLKN